MALAIKFFHILDGKTVAVHVKEEESVVTCAGNAFEGIPYIFKSTYSSNWGRYHIGESNFFYTKPWQLSLALEFEFDKVKTNLPLNLGVGAYGDFGKLYQNSVGLTLRFVYNDSCHF